MDRANPLFPPPDGYRWELHPNVEVFDGAGSPSLLNLPPGMDATDTVFLTNFEGRTTYTHGANFSVAGAATYELARTIYVQIQTYVDGNPDMLMAFGFDAGGISEACGSTSINVNGGDAFRAYSAPPAVWPETLQITYQSHSHSAYAGSLAVEVMKWVGDVWAAVPDTNTPPDGGGGGGGNGGGCPPACSPTTSSTTGPEQAALDTSFEITWPRTNARVAVADLVLGVVAELTYGDEWDGAKQFLLDGFQLELVALADSGYTTRAEYHFTKLPLTDSAGNPMFFTVNVHEVNDPDHPVWG